MEREGNPNPLRNQIEDFLRDNNRLVVVEDGEKARQFAQRIADGETIGDHISDYIFHHFLTGLATDTEQWEKYSSTDPGLVSLPDLSGILDKLQKDESSIREIEGKLKGHVGEEIFVNGSAPGRLRRWVYKLGVVQSSQLKFNIDEEGYSRLAIRTGRHVNRRQNGNPKLVNYDISVYPRPRLDNYVIRDYVVGTEAVAEIRNDSWYGRFYPEMAALLQQSLAMRSSV